MDLAPPDLTPSRFIVDAIGITDEIVPFPFTIIVVLSV
jgi:hypothetical protein